MKPFLKLLKKELRLSTGYGILAVLFLVFERFLTYYASLSQKIEYYKPAKATLFDYAIRYIGFNGFSAAAVCILSGLLSLLVCNYMHNKKRTDFYQSQPFTKTTVFAVKYLSGIIIFLFAYGVSFLLMIFGSAHLGVLCPDVLLEALEGFVCSAAGFVFLYSIFVCAGILTANIITHFVLAAIFSFIIPALYYLKIIWFKIFFETYYLRETAYMLKASPVYYLGSAVFSDSLKPFVIMLAIAAAFTAVSFALVKLRPSEATEKALAFKYTIIPLRIIFSIICGYVGALFLYGIFGEINNLFFCVSFVALTAVSSLIIQIIFYFDFSAVFKGKRWLIVSVGASLAISVVTVCCITAYNTFVPNKNNISSVAFSIANFENDEQYYEELPKDYFDGKTENSTEEEERYFDRVYNDEFTLNNMSITDGELAANALEAFSAPYKVPSYSRFNLVYAGENTTYVKVKCTLKSGRTYYRQYKAAVSECEPVLTELMNNRDYKHGLWCSFYNLAPGDIKSIDVNGVLSNNETDSFSLTEEQSEALFNALDKDLDSTDYKTISETAPLASVELYTASLYKREWTENNRTAYFVSEENYHAANVYIYPSYENTIAELEKIGYTFMSEQEIIDNITKIKFEIYSTLDYPDGLVTEISESEKIAEIYPYTQGSMLCRMKNYNGGLNYELEIYNYNYDYTNSYFICDMSDLPDSIKAILQID